ncbi:MAG: hypothetical protein CL681_24085 [Blastopirellula sp.]|nr:hypothetical protein [Blastopirellula sp.]
MTRLPYPRPERALLLVLLLSTAGSVYGDEAAKGESATAGQPNARELAFFEEKIRPVLVQRCYACHSAEAAAKKVLKGDLRLDTRATVRAGGESGPAIVPGKPNDSLLISALRHDTLKMPPNDKLSDKVITDFVRWIEMGAPDPRDGKTVVRETHEPRTAREKWAYRSPQVAAPPAVQRMDWPQGEIDRWILASLEANQLAPAAPADKRTLIRRAAYDLLGLPPTPAEMDAFLADERPDAFATVVNRMLDSPEFGIRWARHWLDNVRYAQDDPTCNANNNGTFSIAPYRDWVVKAFNEDLPYDQFVRWQVAGDLIPSEDPESVNTDGHTATGIWGLAHVVEGNDKEKVVADFVDEQLDVLGRTFLGLTVSCARCHDHKFDPITQADYYALAGIFYSSHILQFEGKSARVRKRVQTRAVRTQAQLREIEPTEKQLEKLESQVKTLEDKYEKPLELMQVRQELETQQGLEAASANEQAKVARRIKELKDKEATLLEDQKKKGWDEHPAELKQHAQAVSERDALRKKLGQFPLRMVMREGAIPGTRHVGTADMPLFQRGDHLTLGPMVPRAMPGVFTDQGTVAKVTGSGRLQLAHWLTQPDHPLTARVMANRIWQQLCGRGIVATPSNFGNLGQAPTHPELLDYLALRLVAHDWSIKALIREIMASRTYQQASVAAPPQVERDPGNRWFGRMHRKRLDAEALMDTLAWHSGQIQRQEQDAPGWKLALSGRTLFGDFSRDQPQTSLELFDGANPDLLLPRRTDSTSPFQSLFMLNHETVLQAAAKLAEHAMAEADEDPQRITTLYQAVLGRPATVEDQQLAANILEKLRATRKQLAAEESEVAWEVGAWQDLCMALLGSNEFLYVD